MALQSMGFLILLCAAAAALLAGVALLWNRWPRRLSAPMRLLSLLLVMVMGAVLAADVVNRQLGFYFVALRPVRRDVDQRRRTPDPKRRIRPPGSRSSGPTT